MSRRGDTHRVMRWLWTSRRPDARLARLALLPVSGLWRLAMDTRRLAYRQGWFTVHDLPLPSVAVDVPKGESLYVLATGTNDMFAGFGSRTPGAVVIQGASVKVPVVS